MFQKRNRMHVSLLATNAHSLSWWPNGDTNAGQLISEPTNFEENKCPSCIDLIICDQPNVNGKWSSSI